MKVYINARFLTQHITGVQQFAWEICRNLHTSDHEFILLAPPGVKQPEALQHLGFMNIGSSGGYVWEQFQLPRFLRRQGSPLLLNFCNTAPFAYRRQFVTIHDLSFIHHPEWYARSFAIVYNFLIPRISRRAQRVLTVSNTIKAELVQYLKLPEQKISVLYNGLSTALLQAAQPPVQKEKIVLTVSSINPRKNLAGLIAAFAQANLPGYKLLIAGARNQVFAGMQTEVNDANVQFLGYVSDAQLLELYARAEIFASLSFDEGFGIPVLEAGSFGCRLLLSDIRVYRELYDGVATFADPHDVAQCAEGLQSLSQNGAQPNMQQLLQRYSYLHSAGQLLQLLEGKK